MVTVGALDDSYACDAVMQRCIARIGSHTRRLDHMVCDFEDVADAAAGRLALERRELGLARVIALAIQNWIPVESQHRIRIEIRDTARLRGDPVRLQRVFGTLIEVALGRAVGSPVDVRIATKAGVATLAIVDHGPGLTAAQLARVFDGTRDISLFAARIIIEAHGGKLVASSVPGRGSAFRVEIPSTALTSGGS